MEFKVGNVIKANMTDPEINKNELYYIVRFGYSSRDYADIKTLNGEEILCKLLIKFDHLDLSIFNELGD